MKKLALVLLSVITLNSCSMDDGDDFNRVTTLGEVVGHDLPEYFEEGETYIVEVDYLLPDLCHQPLGLQVSRGGNDGDERREIYVGGLVSYDTEADECTLEPEEESDLTATSQFSITIDEEEPYTFQLWVGVDIDGESIFETVVVPVGVPEEEVTE